ncbi:hypothetical protein BBP40_008894 [Aspergillus hancockii]|nr:hypothetical protein BBP40_008894 [Aspergillus hancockii]
MSSTSVEILKLQNGGYSKQTADTSIEETLGWMLSRPPANTTTTTSSPSAGAKFAIRELSSPKDTNRLRWELGYGLDASMWRKGYATEAVRGALEVFGEIKRILEGDNPVDGVEGMVIEEGLWAATAVVNMGSQGVLRKYYPEAENQKRRLRDFLPQDITWIMSYGDDASTFFTKSITDVTNEAEILLSGLSVERSSKEEEGL